MADAVVQDAEPALFIGSGLHNVFDSCRARSSVGTELDEEPLLDHHPALTGGGGMPQGAVLTSSSNSGHPASRYTETAVTGKPNWMLTSKTDDRRTARLLADSYGPKTVSHEAEMGVAVSRMGRTGRAPAGRVLGGGHEATVWNRSQGRTGDLASEGARQAVSVAAAVGGVEVEADSALLAGTAKLTHYVLLALVVGLAESVTSKDRYETAAASGDGDDIATVTEP